MVVDHGHEMPGDPPRPECQEGQKGQGQAMPAEFVEILEKGTKHLPAFACEEDYVAMFSPGLLKVSEIF